MSKRTVTKKSAKKTTSERNTKPRPVPIPTEVRIRLERSLLTLGGAKIVWQDSDPHAALVAAKGQLFPQPVQLRHGMPNRCHTNAADLWAGAPDKYQLVTGYALSGDRWVSHSWVVEGETLVETTYRFDRYFGVTLHPFLALKFWFENVYEPVCRDGEPPDFWEGRFGVLELIAKMRQMPQEEVSAGAGAGGGASCLTRRVARVGADRRAEPSRTGRCPLGNPPLKPLSISPSND
jgi:hypothetical protein